LRQVPGAEYCWSEGALLTAKRSTPPRVTDERRGPLPNFFYGLVLRPAWVLQAIIRLGPFRAIALIVAGFFAAGTVFLPDGADAAWQPPWAPVAAAVSVLAVLVALTSLFSATAPWVRRLPAAVNDRRLLSLVLFVSLSLMWAGFSQVSMSVLAIAWASGLPLLIAAVSLHQRLPKQWGWRAIMLPLVFIALFAVLDCLLRALWSIDDLDQLPESVLLAFSGTVMVGLVAQLQIWESSEAPSRSDSEFPDYSSLRSMEAEWLLRRRSKVALSVDSRAPDPRPANLVGLALSGGGIRSATVSFGFLQGLADVREEGKPLLEFVDYLSTVSGGGWAGGALTARLSCDNPPLDPRSESDWARFARTFRSQGDYLVRGGLGFTTGTLRPLVIILVGLFLTAVTFSTLGASGVLLLSYYSCGNTRATTWLGDLENRFRGARLLGLDLDRAARPLFFDGTENCVAAVTLDPPSYGHHLFALNWLGVAFLASAGAFLLGALAIGLGAVVYAGPLRTAGSWLAAASLKVSVTILVVIGLLMGWTWVPALGSAMLLLLCFAISRRFTRIQLSAIATFVAGAHVALFKFAGPALAAVAGHLKLALGELLLWPAIHAIPPSTRMLWAGFAGLGGVALGFLVSRNHTGLQWFWTERIRNAYLSTGEEMPADWPLSALRPTSRTDRAPGQVAWNDPKPWNIGGPSHGAPLHIINAAINTPGSNDDVLRKRGTARFELSPYAVGGPALGWTDTARYGSSISLAHALAVSAAAVNSEGGQLVPRWARVLLVLSNCGLGQWFRNPTLAFNRALGATLATQDARFRRWGHFWTGYVAREVLARNSEHDTLVFVSDGGHHDNLGLGALVDRGCRLIVCVDAAADPDFSFTDLARVAEMLHVDAGWTVSLRLDDARPKNPNGTAQERHVQSSVLIGEIKNIKESISLVYVKASVEAGAPFGVLRYAERHPAFPQQSTANQFFDESQFEAYRKLGEHLARRTNEVLRDKLGHLAGCGKTPVRGSTA
jgi:hypothetical protein